MKTLNELLKEFDQVVNASHIKTASTAGAEYTYIAHPILSEGEHLSEEDYRKWEEHYSNFLYNND